MTKQKLKALLVAGAFTAIAATGLLSPVASAAVIRTFDSVPSGDTLNQYGGSGAVLNSPGSPGNQSNSLNNNAAAGFADQTYAGGYQIGNGNVLAGLGASPLSNFTIVYAYKPDSPNQMDQLNAASRQLRMYDPTSTASPIDITISNRRPQVTVNGVVWTPIAAASQRIMDGDSTTIINPPPSTGGTGTFAANNPTEWVFYAITFQATSATTATVSQYGMPESQVSYGLRTLDSLDKPVTPSVSLTNVVVDLATTRFFSPGATYRPFDGRIDAFGFYAEVLSLAELNTLATNALVAAVVPEPGALLLMTICVLGLSGVFRHRRAAA